MNRLRTIVLGSCLTLIGGFAVAGPRDAHRSPPPEALAACSGLTHGAACTVAFEGKSTGGTCRTFPGSEAAACVPTGRGSPGRGPPPEAFSACENKSVGAACSVPMGDHTADGTCEAGRQDDRVHCRPAHR